MNDLIKVRKAPAGAQTSITIANADTTAMTPPTGLLAAVAAVQWTGVAAAGATGLVQIKDGATAIITLTIPAANLNFYQEFSTPLPITSTGNDLQITVTQASQTGATVAVWFKYV